MTAESCSPRALCTACVAQHVREVSPLCHCWPGSVPHHPTPKKLFISSINLGRGLGNSSKFLIPRYMSLVYLLSLRSLLSLMERMIQFRGNCATRAHEVSSSHLSLGVLEPPHGMIPSSLQNEQTVWENEQKAIVHHVRKQSENTFLVRRKPQCIMGLTLWSICHILPARSKFLSLIHPELKQDVLACVCNPIPWEVKTGLLSNLGSTTCASHLSLINQAIENQVNWKSLLRKTIYFPHSALVEILSSLPYSGLQKPCSNPALQALQQPWPQCHQVLRCHSGYKTWGSQLVPNEIKTNKQQQQLNQ